MRKNLQNKLPIKGFKEKKRRITCFKKATELNEEDAVSYSNIGSALISLDRMKEAISYCRRAIELDHNLAVAYNNLGDALYMNNKLNSAI